MRKLKVYGGLLFKDGKQEAVVCAVSSQRELAEITGCSLYEIRGWWAEAGNKEDTAQALAKPHQIIWTNRHLIV